MHQDFNVLGVMFQSDSNCELPFPLSARKQREYSPYLFIHLFIFIDSAPQPVIYLFIYF